MKAAANPAAHHAADEFIEKATRVTQDIRELGSVTKDAAVEVYEQGLEKAKQLEKTMENRIREHPLQSVLIAAGVGFLAGFLVSRR
jgi:ElaB/YqjD/DUF883 family membrane-anchored ribosome-binding protein